MLSDSKRQLLGKIGFGVLIFSTLALVGLTSITWMLETQNESEEARDRVYRANPAAFRGGGSSQMLLTFRDFRNQFAVPLIVAGGLGLALTLAFRVGPDRLASYSRILRSRSSEAMALTLFGCGCLMMCAAVVWLGLSDSAISSAEHFDQADLSARTFPGRPSPDGDGGLRTLIYGQPSNQAFWARNEKDVELPFIGLLFGAGAALTAAGLIYRLIVRRVVRRAKNSPTIEPSA